MPLLLMMWKIFFGELMIYKVTFLNLNLFPVLVDNKLRVL